MVGNTAVIGKSDPLNPYGDVGKYLLGAQDPSSVVKLGSEDQTLMPGAMFFSQPGNGTAENPGGSKLIFTKLLTDGDEVIPATAESVKFIWAVGYNGDSTNLLGHQMSGSFDIPLEPCGNFIAQAAKDALDYQRALKIHGILGAVAFGLLVPLSIAASTFRQCLDFEVRGTKVWVLVHAGFQMISYILAIFVLIIAFLAKKAVNGYNLKKTHEKAGIALFALVTIQVILASMRPRAATKETEKNAEAAVDGFDDQDGEAPPVVVQKSRARLGWEIGHKLSAFAIVGLTMYQIPSGIDLYEKMFGSAGLDTLYWVWFGIVLALMVCVAFRAITNK